MKISDLKDGASRVNVTGKIVEKEAPREINTRDGRQTRVANLVLEDESGTIVLTLWGDEIDKVSQGDTVKIENGYIKEWKGSLQLSVGKYGKMTVV
jgi:replication factor A1